jgi:integrase
MSVHQTPDGRWFVRFPKGTLPDKPQATREYYGRGLDAENRARLRNDELGFGKKIKGSGRSFADLAKYYLESKSDKIEDRSIDTAFVHITVHLIPFFGPGDIMTLTEEMADHYVTMRRRQKWVAGGGKGKAQIGVSRSTIKRELGTMQAVLNFAVRRKLIIYNPLQHYDMPREDDAVISPATASEIRAILSVSPPHLQRFIILAWYTACRPGFVELLSMKWDQIDFSGKYVFIKSAKKGGLVSRKVKMHPDLEQCLVTWYEEELSTGNVPTHIVHYQGQPIKKVDKAWAAAKKRAKVLRRLRTYDIRHSAITQMFETSSDPRSISLIAGHSSTRMTMDKYQHSSSRLQEVAISSLVTVSNFLGESKSGKGNTGA